MYPALKIFKSRIAGNVRSVVKLCDERGIKITGITKGVRGDPTIAKIFVENGVNSLGDSRTENLARLEGFGVERWLIRMPSISRAEETVRCSEVSLNTESETILALDHACSKLGRRHKIVLMYELGELREGYMGRDDLRRAADFVRKCPHLELAGVGANLTCFNSILADTDKLTELVEAARDAGATAYVSGGNSETFPLMLSGGVPEGVNFLRLGEALLYGRNRARYIQIPDTRDDAFELEAEIIELKEKPSMPWGEVGVDICGRSPVFHDRGIRRRAICAVGHQDILPEETYPVDPGVQIIGTSSDHLVVDVSDSKEKYRVGGIVRFKLQYFSMMRAWNSDYVERQFVD